MPKEKTIFVCQNCGNESLKWAGKCSICGQWNTLKEVTKLTKVTKARKETKPEKLKNIKIEKWERVKTGISEFDRVLGGGIVPGSLVLLGGEPGIGKSTLLLQMASQNMLYVSGEESGEQIKLRADRLKIDSDKIYILAETDIETVLDSISNLKPKIAVVDSIQAMFDQNYPSTPGSIVQVRDCALKLQNLAKSTNIPVILTGHLTKEGAVAGPKTLEHLVDVVLYLEGERFQDTRILHGTKNRFGATEEVGVFEMTEKGLLQVKNPSKVFLEERRETPGGAVTAILSGTRAFLVEIQALVSKTSFGYPKRMASGFDLRRLDLLLAVLEKRLGLPLFNFDVYVNIVGGMRIEDRAADLALCLSIFSIFKNKKIRPKTVLFGEVGLAGEIRSVIQMERRIKEAKALGFVNIIGPEAKTLEAALKRAIVT